MITYGNTRYWAEIKRDKKSISNYNHFIKIYREGEKTPIIGAPSKGSEALISVVNQLIENFEKNKNNPL